MTRAPVFRRRRCRGRGARLVDPRQLRGAEGGPAGDDEPRRTPRRDAVRRRQLGVPAIPLRHQGRDGDEHGHHRHRGRLRRRRKPRRPPRSSPSRATSVPTKKPAAINAVEGARPERHRRRSNPARGRRRTPAHHARSGRGTQHARTWSAPRRPRASGSTPTSPTSSPRCSSPPGRTGAQVVEGANAITTAEVQDGDLYVSVSIASLEVGTVGGGTKLPTQSGASISSASAAAATRRLQRRRPRRCIAVGSLAGELSLLSALASRHLSSAHAELGR